MVADEMVLQILVAEVADIAIIVNLTYLEDKVLVVLAS
jgi:hypothetical protein